MTSTLSNDISPEAIGHLRQVSSWYLRAGGLTVFCFYENCLLSLVAMTLKVSIMWKTEKMTFTAKLLQLFRRKYYRNVS